MRSIFSLMALMMLTGCLPTFQPKQVVVDGTALLEFEPEIFQLSAEIRGRGDEREAVFSEISETLDRVRSSLPGLEGVTHLEIETANVRIDPVYESGCAQAQPYGRDEGCPVVGYFSSIDIGVKGAPASRAGSAFSFLSELGAESVVLSGYALLDQEAAQQKAIDAAVSDARAKADGVAAASGAAVTGLLRIQYGDGFNDPYSRDIFVHSPRAGVPRASDVSAFAAAVDLVLEPHPIKVDAKVVAAFSIE